MLLIDDIFIDDIIYNLYIKKNILFKFSAFLQSGPNL
jgi:hypothetical protein